MTGIEKSNLDPWEQEGFTENEWLEEVGKRNFHENIQFYQDQYRDELEGLYQGLLELAQTNSSAVAKEVIISTHRELSKTLPPSHPKIETSGWGIYVGWDQEVAAIKNEYLSRFSKLLRAADQAIQKENGTPGVKELPRAQKSISSVLSALIQDHLQKDPEATKDSLFKAVHVIFENCARTKKSLTLLGYDWAVTKTDTLNSKGHRDVSYTLENDASPSNTQSCFRSTIRDKCSKAVKKRQG
jgi:hypothetical protein